MKVIHKKENRVNKNRRMNIPQSIQREILFRNEAVCCICQKSQIQIHHIDGNHNNNKLSNLAVLCLEHHSSASSSGNPISKRISPSLIKKFKNDWEFRIANKRGSNSSHGKNKLDSWEKNAIKFEIKKLVYYLTSFKTKKQVDEIMDQLYQWHIWEGHTRYILEKMVYIHWLFSDEQIKYISNRIFEFFWHLPGPDMVQVKEKDKINLQLAMELLTSFGSQLAILGSNKKMAMNSIMDAWKEIFEIAVIYKNRKLRTHFLDNLKKTRKKWQDSDYSGKQKILRLIDSCYKVK
jgi:hypothetical protein